MTNTPNDKAAMADEIKRLAQTFGESIIRLSHEVNDDNIVAMSLAEKKLHATIDALRDYTPPGYVLVPPEIAGIAERLHTQDNRITDNPLFAVQQKREYVGSEDYNDDSEMRWVNDAGGEADEEEASRLDAAYRETYSEPEGWRRVNVFPVWEFVTGCFTEQGCKDFIRVNGHNLNEPRIYAYGSHRNAEFIALRKWLMSIRVAAGTATPSPDAEGAATLCAVGWIRADGSMHKGCPPIQEPDGWRALLVEDAERSKEGGK
jgi:hypothetical protein